MGRRLCAPRGDYLADPGEEGAVFSCPPFLQALVLSFPFLSVYSLLFPPTPCAWNEYQALSCNGWGRGSLEGQWRSAMHCSTLGETASNFYSIDPPQAAKPHGVYLEN